MSDSKNGPWVEMHDDWYIVWNDPMVDTTNNAVTPQPDPQPGQDVVLNHALASVAAFGHDVDDLRDQVTGDLLARAKMGEEKYGTMLMTHNGRDALWDAYQESLDLLMYIEQKRIELMPGWDERIASIRVHALGTVFHLRKWLTEEAACSES